MIWVPREAEAHGLMPSRAFSLPSAYEAYGKEIVFFFKIKYVQLYRVNFKTLLFLNLNISAKSHQIFKCDKYSKTKIKETFSAQLCNNLNMFSNKYLYLNKYPKIKTFFIIITFFQLLLNLYLVLEYWLGSPFFTAFRIAMLLRKSTCILIIKFISIKKKFNDFWYFFLYSI